MKRSGLLLFLLTALVVSVGTAVSEPPIPPNYLMCYPSTQLQNEEQIFVNPNDSLIVLADWRDFRLGYRQVAIGRSTDGGNTWTNSLINPLMTKFKLQSDPAMAVDNDGNFYVCFLDFLSQDSSYISFIKSSNNGASWTGPYTVEDTTGPYMEDKQFIWIDRSTSSPYEGNVYVAWARLFNPGRIMFARSTDGAVNWDDTLVIGPPVDVSYCDDSGILYPGQFAFPFSGSDGAVYVAWEGFGLDSSTCSIYKAIFLVKSTDGGGTFTTPRRIFRAEDYPGQVDGGVDVYIAPICASDFTGGAYDGNLYIAYSSVDTTNPLRDRNIEFSKSTDGGDTWSEPIYINDDYTGPGALFDQFHPWIICNEEGTLIAIWYDQRTDPNHYKFDVFAAYSFDGGDSWTTNHRISEVSVDPDFAKNDEFSAENERPEFDPEGDISSSSEEKSGERAGLIAEYIGVTAFKDHVNATWTDTRDLNQNVYGANWVIPLMAPRPVYPSDDELVPPDLSFNWATAWKTNDDEYDFEVATDDQFASIILSETLTKSEYTPASSLTDGIYYWRVKARILSTAGETDWSATVPFQVTSYIPAVPEPVVPADLDTVYNTGMPTFTWNQPDVPPVPISYALEISDDDLFSSPVVYDGLTATTFVIPEPLAEGHYYWRLEAVNDFGQSQGYSPVFQFDQISFICGDADNNGKVDVLDIIYLIGYKFKGGTPPELMIACDVNSDGKVDVLDIIYLITYKFKGGADPVCPA